MEQDKTQNRTSTEICWHFLKIKLSLSYLKLPFFSYIREKNKQLIKKLKNKNMFPCFFPLYSQVSEHNVIPDRIMLLPGSKMCIRRLISM